MLPKDFVAGKKYPLVVTVHGGPSAACVSQWDERNMGPLSAMGYFALCPNPRGSYGQGEAFTQGNVKDFGGGDYRDIMAGVDALSEAISDRYQAHRHSRPQLWRIYDHVGRNSDARVLRRQSRARASPIG